MEYLKPPAGAVKAKKRIGRGKGSGKGKTSGKGNKGQKARKGGGVRPGFEGGQTPLYRRLPKRGFNNKVFANEYNEINLFLLNRFDDGVTVAIEDYIKEGLLSSKRLKVKILGSGDIKKKLNIYADKFSKSAVEKIEKAGGKAIVISNKKDKE